MATLKYIIKNKAKKNGKHSIYLQLTHNRKPTTIKTGVEIYKTEWSKQKQRIIKINGSKKTDNISKFNYQLNSKLNEIEIKLYELEKTDNINAINVSELRNLLLNKKTKKPKDITVFKYWENHIDTYFFKSINSKKLHITALNSFKEFSKIYNYKNLHFEGITITFLEMFENWHKRKGNKANTSATNLRLLRRLFNIAINDNLVKIDKYPFGRKFHIKTNEPNKRALTLDELNSIIKIELENPKLEFARNLFLISYYMGGIPFIDLCQLKYSNFKDDFLKYKRTKTNVKVNNVINAKLETLLYKFIKPNGKESDYIFDFITNDDFSVENLEYNRARDNYHNSLKKLGKICNLKLTSYVARHTFATLALNTYNFPISYVKSLLGHKKIRTTQIYIGEFAKKDMKQYADRL